MPGELAEQTRTGDPRQQLPSVSAVLEHDGITDLLSAHPRPLVLEATRETLDYFRLQLAPGDAPPTLDTVFQDIRLRLTAKEQDRLRPVINATGVILHTGLGRAVLPACAAAALGQLDHFCNLQIDLETGRRGKRNYMTESLLCRLTGAEAALVVNNNAAATLLVLKALCVGREVVVSRGQLIEIGGSFRLPDCIHESGARLVEVGTTNKTHLRDYEEGLSESTGAVMRVNPSNYSIVGFSKSVPVEDLVTLKQGRELLVIDDLGCGALIDLREFGLPHEPTVQESITAGADIALFSGDKLIGGPQSGIIVGKKELVTRIRKHPLTRMLRVGKLTDMALEHTMRLFLEPEKLVKENPTLRALSVSHEQLEREAAWLAAEIRQADGIAEVKVVREDSALGGGSLPATPLPTYAVAVTRQGWNAETLSAALRRQEPPVVARVRNDAVLLDVRTLLPGEAEVIAAAFRNIAGEST